MHLENYTIINGYWPAIAQQQIFRDWKLLCNIPGLGHLISKNYELKLLSFEGEILWTSPLRCSGKPDSATVSGDRLIITTTTQDYHAWGFLGPVLLIDLKKAEIIEELKGERIHGLKNGEFLVGLEGYDFFHTWLYDRDCNQLQEWNSYGEYVSVNDEIIVIEENRQNPDSSSLVRLNRDGSVSKSVKLKSSRSSNPILIGDNNFLFENGGDLITSNGNLKKLSSEKLLTYNPDESWRFSSRLSHKGEHILVEILERISEPIENYRTHIFKIPI